VDETLSGSDRELVREALREVEATPAPADRAPLGCVIALPGFVLLLVFPVVGRMMHAGRGLAEIVLGLGVVLLVVGLGIWFTSGGMVRKHASAAAEAALRELEREDQADREVLLRAATLLLTNAYTTYGPSMVASTDFADARARLGKRLSLVVAVERMLLDEDAIYPAFTRAEEAGGEGGSED